MASLIENKNLVARMIISDLIKKVPSKYTNDLTLLYYLWIGDDNWLEENRDKFGYWLTLIDFGRNNA